MKISTFILSIFNLNKYKINKQYFYTKKKKKFILKRNEEVPIKEKRRMQTKI